jgi:branched-chain amino acid transport system substrate-binding protein
MRSRLCLGLAALLWSAGAAGAADLTVGFVTSLSGPGASIGIPYEKAFSPPRFTPAKSATPTSS